MGGHTTIASTLAGTAALTAALAAACGSPLGFERDVEAPIQTSRLDYELREVDRGVETDIEYEFRNRTSAPIFIVNCNGSTGVRLEKLIGGEWVGAWGNTTPDCLSPPIVIDPGQAVTRTLSVFGGHPGCGCAPQFSFEEREGIYRMVLVDVLDSFDENLSPFGTQIPEEERVSNRFRLDE